MTYCMVGKELSSGKPCMHWGQTRTDSKVAYLPLLLNSWGLQYWEPFTPFKELQKLRSIQ